MTAPDSSQIRRPWWALVVAIAALAMATALVTSLPEETGAADAAHPPSTAMAMVAPGGVVELASLPMEHQMLYQAAGHASEAFEHVRCYCGCEAFLDHRHLGDCFVRPDGGWERHATGCAICLAEARDVVRLLEEDRDIDHITRFIDDRYGAAVPAA